MNWYDAPPEYLQERIAAWDQLVRARLTELCDGDGRGSRLVDIDNGSGLAFSLLPDRGMDLYDASFRGVPVAFKTAGGLCAPGRRGGDWLRSWPGGLLTTCGLSNVGEANGEHGLHGRISGCSASDLQIRRGWRDGRCRLEVSGRLTESSPYGEHWSLRRTVSTALGDNSIGIEDAICNESSRADHLQLLYHLNFGFPFLAPELELRFEPAETLPRDEQSREGLRHWRRMREPRCGDREEVFRHRMLPDADGMVRAVLCNPACGVTIRIEYRQAELPWLMQWHRAEPGGYVLALEPGNGTLAGRAADIAAGEARRVEPGEKVVTRLKITFE